MEDKRLVEEFKNMALQELTFTKEDRNKVFEQLHHIEEENRFQKKSPFSISKLTPLTVSLLVVGLCLFLFIPQIHLGTVSNNYNGTATNGVVSQIDQDFTALFMVKDENDRLPINLLLSYSKDKKMMKVISIPRDTYAPILNKKDRTTPYDKLSHAYLHGSEGAEDVRKTVSELFDVPIDYYAVLDLKTFSTMVDGVNGIEYDLKEDMRVRALSTVAFEFKKGTHRLTGEEVVALLMDATAGRNLHEEDQLNLLNAVINQTKSGLTQTQLKEFTTKVEGDFPIGQLVGNEMKIQSIQTVSLSDGMKDERIDGAYYITFEKEFLQSVSKELTTFN